jgi:thiol-disulfide isomerase/thioredoxin
MPRSTLLVVPLVSALLLAGCGGAASEEAAEPAPTTSSAAPEPTEDGTPEESPSDTGQQRGEPTEVPDSLDFTATTVSGDGFEGASLAGRPTLLWFWAPWCPTCRGQIPQVEGLAEEHGEKLNVVGVGSLDSAEAIAGFAAEVDSGITHLEDTEGQLWQRFGVTEQSSFVLLDAEGAVAFEAGYGGSDELGDQVADVVG